MAGLTDESTLKLIFLSVLAFVAVTSNLTVCIAFCKNDKLLSAFSLVIVSLAIADMFNGLLVIPSYCIFVFESSIHNNNIGYYFYAVYICFDIFFGITSIYNLTLMSIDRALMMATPNFHNRTLADKGKMKRLLPIPWLLGLFLTIPKILEYIHGVEGRIIVIIYFVFAFVLPCLIIVICYGYIFNRRIKFVRVHQEHTRKDLRLAYTVLAIIIIFFICWTPFFGIMLYYALCNNCAVLSDAVVMAKWLQFFHSCCNPFIYALLQPKFRHEFKKVIKSCLMREQSSRQHDEDRELERQPMSEYTNMA